jgi:hypothetical protein
MRNLWIKIKEFFSKIWNGLSRAGRIIVGIILLALIGTVVYVSVNKNDDNNKDKSPDVAQVYEPSIGTPLPPDEPNTNGQVGGATTTQPSPTPTPAPSTTPPATSTENRTAPHTGVDPKEPVQYSNDSLNFAATLPAGSNVKELPDQIVFTSKAGALQYIVSVAPAKNETLSSLASQLKNSPSISTITPSNFQTHSALLFNSKDYGQGLVFIQNGQAYYLLGNNQYFTTFRTI